MRFIIASLIILNSAIAFGQSAEFSFDRRVFKSDPIREGEELQYSWEFINSGDEPLIISHYKVECTCTKVDYPKVPVMPGEKAEISMRFDSAGKSGWQYRKIQLFANTDKNPTEVEFRVKVLTD